MSSVKVSFHKSLLPYTNGVKEVEMTTDVIYFLFLNSLNLFPELERLVKHARFSKLEEIAIIHKGKCLSTEEFLFLAKDGETYYLVPIFKGSGIDPVSAAFLISFTLNTSLRLLQGQSLGKALAGGFISGVFAAVGAYAFGSFSTVAQVGFEGPTAVGTTVMQGTFASYAAAGLASAVGSIVSNAVVPIKPKIKSMDSADSGDRRNNDAFDGQINTIHPNHPVPINYGMLRVSGQIISADVDTINHDKGASISVASYV